MIGIVATGGITVGATVAIAGAIDEIRLDEEIMEAPVTPAHSLMEGQPRI
jgi:hypothetical protein